MQPDLDTAVIVDLVGPDAKRRGAEYARLGLVASTEWSSDGTVLDGTVQGSRSKPYRVNILFRSSPSAGGRYAPVAGVCSCPVHMTCKHVAATLFAVRSEQDPSADGDLPNPLWERQLQPLTAVGSRTPPEPLAIQFSYRTHPRAELAITPLTRGQRERWIRNNLSWTTFSQPGIHTWDPAQVEVLTGLAALLHEEVGIVRRPGEALLNRVPSLPLWSLLTDAVSAGIALVVDRRGEVGVQLESEPAQPRADTRADASGLSIRPEMVVGEERFDLDGVSVHGTPERIVAIGEPDGPLRLARLAHPIPPSVKPLFATPAGVRVPAADQDRFLDQYFGRLRAQVAVESGDDSFTPPTPRRPELRLSLQPRPDHALQLSWDWWYRRDSGDPGEVVSLIAGLGSAERDIAAEQEILSSLGLRHYDLLTDDTPARTLLARAVLREQDMITFQESILPELEGRPGLVIVRESELGSYQPARNEPTITVRTEEVDGERDWFDLSVDVEVDGQQVPFSELFSALAAGKSVMILPDGTYFSLVRPEFERLVELIEEARQLGETRPDGVAVSRYQLDWWSELVELGVVAEQAEAWRTAVAGLTGDLEQPRIEPPAGFTGTLRDYQRDGLDWLAFLHEHQLGGVLADDMGLGKTLQALALICHARSQADPGAPPFLVVAPTSVVGNWAAEAERFAPLLKTAVITETRRRANRDLTEVTADADLVITSYTLLRIDSDSYQSVGWSGLLLDEAQFVKNHQSKAYQCVRRLEAPFKLAITGTPLENNLGELWSMFSITAPGLFGGPTHFRDTYQRPIERENDSELLQQLRRRVRPLMMRRTKDGVAAELPARQEQVIELDLLPKHRRVYQTHLQRERQKILGLLDDLDNNRFEVFRSLTLLRQLSLDAALHDDEYADIPSTKLQALEDLISEIVGEGHRVLIFSQFTRFLTKVADLLHRADIEYAYLDGRTKNRDAAIARFKEGTAPAFLISLKAGGFGLNLTEADYCILLDPWWNPATEQQAIDRTHRIGQTQNVMVYRMVARETIEEKVMALKEEKAKLFASVMDGGAVSDGKLNAAEIRELIA